jgi:hypothetical protein
MFIDRKTLSRIFLSSRGAACRRIDQSSPETLRSSGAQSRRIGCGIYKHPAPNGAKWNVCFCPLDSVLPWLTTLMPARRRDPSKS